MSDQDPVVIARRNENTPSPWTVAATIMSGGAMLISLFLMAVVALK